METVVVTSFTPAGYRTYGHNFLKTWDMHGPDTNRLIVYTHNQRLKGREWINAEAVPTIRDFLARHEHNQVVHGRVPDGKWKASEVEAGYSFRFNAYVFGRKPLIIADAMRRLPRETKLFWLDADVVILKGIPGEMFSSLLPSSDDMAFLPASDDLTDSSCVGFNLSRDSCREFIEEFESIYAEDKFFDEICWDDGHVFDYLVARRKPLFRYIRSHCHPFEQSVLGKYMFHLRGPSKHDRAKVAGLLAVSQRMYRHERTVRETKKRRR